MFFYQLFGFIFSLVIFPVLLINKKTRTRLAERYGLQNSIPKGEYYWFHGASLGEVNGLEALINQLKAKEPSAKILGTATSIKGVEKLESLVDQARLLPIDNIVWLNLVLKNIKIKKFVFGETELWPALISYLYKRQVPIFLVNGRISEFKLNTYLKFRKFFAKVLNQINKIYAIDKQHVHRFVQIGAELTNVIANGNLKYDQSFSKAQIEPEQKINFIDQKPILTISCIRPDEESILLDVIKREDFNIILAPRHPEKFDFFKDFLAKNQIKYVCRSEKTDIKGILFLDSFGELECCYSISQVSIICGSFITGIGGHNPMEAAQYSNLIIIGPHYENQSDCVAALLANDAIFVKKTGFEINETLNLIKNYNEVKFNARSVWESYQGISKSTFESIF